MEKNKKLGLGSVVSVSVWCHWDREQERWESHLLVQ